MSTETVKQDNTFENASPIVKIIAIILLGIICFALTVFAYILAKGTGILLFMIILILLEISIVLKSINHKLEQANRMEKQE